MPKTITAQVCRMQCGSEGKTLFLDTSTQTMYNQDGSVFVSSVLHKSCNMLPVPLEYIEIEVKDEENTDFRTEVPPSVATSSREELSGNRDEPQGEIQSGGELRNDSQIFGRVDETIKSPDETVDSGAVPKTKPRRPASRTRR
jgi:hypothetical protein